jgi:hypothetical protein
MVQTHKFLDVPGHEVIGAAVYDYVVHHTDILQAPVFWNWLNHEDLLTHVPELKHWLDKQNFKVDHISIIYIEYPAEDLTHIDDDQNLRILWPIKNCQHSYTVFYDISKKYWYQELGNGGPADNGAYHHAVKPNCPRTELGHVELVQPVVFNPALAHNVILSKPLEGPRLSMTIGFDHNDPRSKSLSAW